MPRRLRSRVSACLGAMSASRRSYRALDCSATGKFQAPGRIFSALDERVGEALHRRAVPADTEGTAKPRCLEGWVSMRIGIVLTLIWLLLAPATALAESPARCEYLNMKITHFEAQQERAEQLGNDLWADRFADHLSELKERRKACPGYSDADVAKRQMKELMELAANGAIKFFTWGMAPGL